MVLENMKMDLAICLDHGAQERLDCAFKFASLVEQENVTVSPELKFKALLCLLFLSYLFAEHHLFAFQALLPSKLLVVKNNCERTLVLSGNSQGTFL